MDSSFTLTHKRDEMLASGDASCAENLVLSPSLLRLLPDPITEDCRVRKHCIQEDEIKLSEKGHVVTKQCRVGSPVFLPIGNLRKTHNRPMLKRKKLFASYTSSNRDGKTLDQTNNTNPQRSQSNKCLKPTENQPTVNLSRLARLFSCQVCRSSPMTSTTVHTCSKGHQVCGYCFNNGSLMCEICEEPLEGRNKPIETMLQKLQIIRPEVFFQEFLTCSDTDNFEEVSNTKATQYTSHKPVHCPHLSCQRVVSFNGFLSHFKFEHSSVPVVTLTPDFPHPFFLSESFLGDTNLRVVSVFKVLLTGERDAGNVFQDRDTVICCLLSTSLRFGGGTSLAIWCSCLYEGSPSPLTYQLKAPNTRRLIVYQGPVTSLHESAECILKEGRCLIIAPKLLENLSFQIENPNLFQLNFSIIN